ncbi:nitrate reductase delta subunit [Candidatus Methanoperedens nitroreducens]|uniref:Nitrate reductase delta subunit n=1 Tax=Candidatus Methanoperedens nitratireducens TaxID=1392998 RepID=A0A062UTH5_9EURY|nr:molecular chaperone TorD family protein [Candidatus Methanoperedens nitroreducens]KCZ70346.1 nitrate reductase delta subunit [Candidatus Methanoperedens nitroreducens]
MHKEMYADSVLPDRERMLMYKTFATAFSYPDDNLFGSFSLADEERKELVLEYDRLFRANNIWLYGTEYKALNEFQRVQYLSDIMGFYRAFGLEPDRDRPDSLHIELEFMYYLIFKKLHALNKDNTADSKEKAFICTSAQRKFFTEHLQPAAEKIAGAIISKSKNSFYIQTANEMLEFLGSEEELFRRST